MFGENGIASGARRGSILVDFSSIAPDATREMAKRLEAETGMIWIDAPVSGGCRGPGRLARDHGRRAGRGLRTGQAGGAGNGGAVFTLMGPSGAGPDDEAVQPGHRRLHHGGAGGSHAAGTNAGVDAERLPEALAGGFADSKPLQLFVPRMVKAVHDPPPATPITMLKDLDSVGGAGASCGFANPLHALLLPAVRLLTSRGGNEAEALEIYKLTAPKTPLRGRATRTTIGNDRQHEWEHDMSIWKLAAATALGAACR